MNKVDYAHCDHCGFEGFDLKIAYSRATANRDWYLCPSCGQEICDVEIEELPND